MANETPQGASVNRPLSKKDIADMLLTSIGGINGFSNSTDDSKLDEKLISDVSDAYARALESVGLNFVDGLQAYSTKFNTNMQTLGLDPQRPGHSFVFFTRPDLNICKLNVDQMPFFNYVMNTEIGNLVCETLQYPGRSSKTSAVKLDDKYKTDSPFDPLMTNLCKEVTGLKDLVMEKWETEGDFKGHQLQYASGTDGFDSIGEVTISFEDTTTSPMFLKHFLWFQYITEVCKGTINPRMAYIRERVIDYTCSIYGFKLAEDNTTILRFWKLTGCFPISVPMNTLYHSRDMKIEEFDDIQVTYAYNMYEPMNPNTIRDFNALSMRHAFTRDSSGGSSGGKEGDYPPFVSSSDSYNMMKHQSPEQLIEVTNLLRNSQAKGPNDVEGIVSLWSSTPIIVGNKLVWI